MTPMTHVADAPPLLTDADVLDRVTELVGPAAVRRQLWVLFLDGDRRQTPVMMPIEDLSDRLDELPPLAPVLEGVLPMLATASGPGAVVLVLERRGPDVPTADDERWAEQLTTGCGDVVLDGVYLSTPGGVRRLRGMQRSVAT
jgi:hypothetical protein